MAMAPLPVRRRRALGDYTWTDYLNGAAAPPNGQVTSPNGDIVVFDANGIPDHTIPHPGSGADADVEKDPASPFFGWTNLEKAQYAAARGATDLTTDATVASQAGGTPGANGVVAVDPAVQAASDAALRAGSSLNPKVVSALNNGIVMPGAAASAAASQAANDEEIKAEANAALQSIIRGGGMFTDTLPPGETFDAAFLRGMISTQQWLADYINVAHGGQATNAIAAAGKLPPNAPLIVASSATSGGDTGTSGGGLSQVNPGSAMDLGGNVPPSSPSAIDGGSSLSKLAIAGLGVGVLLLFHHGSRKR